ncbi:MAG: formylglycine-generating enzyme family protein [Proteobacteria bacterium]|nr:formylglycine-generating enzyme family protein [Pseudomonadota bacterium]
MRQSRAWSAVRAALPFVAVAASAFATAFGLVDFGARAFAASPPPLLCDRYSGEVSSADPHAGMVRLAGGRYTMGSDDHYAEEALTHEVRVDGFWIDRHDVTNAQFARFVAATGYRTVAERMPDLQRHPDLPDAMRVPGSVVFVMPEGGHAGHWRYSAGADWRHPQGPGSSIAGLANHPVVQVAYEDALAYAHWLGRELPTEAQWEYAARGGLEEQTYVWGNEYTPHGKAMANTWQGLFPVVNTATDGYAGTSPVGCYAANGYGLYDMAGNVWQWTSTWFSPGHGSRAVVNPVGPDELESYDPRQPGVPAKVIKGGSYLCAPNYCMRYRPAARQARETDSGTSHIGFRTVAKL